MHLFFIFFSFLLVSVSSLKFADIPKETLSGFTHIQAFRIAKDLANSNGVDWKHTHLCHYYYCRGQCEVHQSCDNRIATCEKHCFAFLKNKDTAIVETRVRTLNTTKPAVDEKDCVARCTANCGEDACGPACEGLCTSQFSYDDRKEYESEFLELLGRLNKLA